MGAGEYYLEELEETICAKEAKKLAMYHNMCRTMYGTLSLNGVDKSKPNENGNIKKEVISTDKSDNENINKTEIEPLSVKYIFINTYKLLTHNTYKMH